MGNPRFAGSPLELPVPAGRHTRLRATWLPPGEAGLRRWIRRGNSARSRGVRVRELWPRSRFLLSVVGGRRGVELRYEPLRRSDPGALLDQVGELFPVDLAVEPNADPAVLADVARAEEARR